VEIIVYADESGTHDKSGMLPGSEVAVMAGYAAKADSWIKFCRDWASVLAQHSAPYFHFSEFASASAVVREKRELTTRYRHNPYFGWDLDRLDAFLLDLARVASAGNKVPVGGYVDTRGYAEYLRQTPEERLRNPHEGGVWWFYDSAISSIQSRWPKLQGHISFVFDQTDDPEWKSAIIAVHNSWKRMNSRIQRISFGDKKAPANYPLQAADMVAYRMRQLAGKYRKYDPKIPDSMPPLDRILFGNFVGEEFKRLFPIQ